MTWRRSRVRKRAIRRLRKKLRVYEALRQRSRRILAKEARITMLLDGEEITLRSSGPFGFVRELQTWPDAGVSVIDPQAAIAFAGIDRTAYPEPLSGTITGTLTPVEECDAPVYFSTKTSGFEDLMDALLYGRDALFRGQRP